MARKNVSYRLSEQAYYSIKQMQEETGYTQTELVELAVNALYYSDIYNRIKEHEENIGISFDGRRVDLVRESVTNIDVRHYAFKAINEKVEDWQLVKEVAELS